MIKIEMPKTWAYENFITDEEKEELVSFCYEVRPLFQNNGPGRFYLDHVESKLKLPVLYKTIKKRIIDTEKFLEYRLDPTFGDFISFNETGAAIHPHTDPNHFGKIHTRYNLLLSLPEQGGNPIYDGKILQVKEKMLWRCEAGLYTHESLPVTGIKPRINISFGFQL